MDLRLTDDEVVAVAINGSSYWPGPLPTVDTDAEASLSTALARGQRSLMVRELIDGEGTPSQLLEMIGGAIVGSESFLSVFIGDDDFNRVGWGLATTHHPSTGGWLVESVNEIGVHDFTLLKDDEHVGALIALARSAFESADQLTEPVWLCLASLSGEGTEVLAVRDGEAQVIRFPDPLGEAVEAEIESVEAVESWLRAATRKLSGTSVSGSRDGRGQD